ncbi:MAG: hypothetical protein JWM95_4291 [Gemmatimonadetes bacterium]|nr:hypothetical protein [Gemmatimonadota bacterium]
MAEHIPFITGDDAARLVSRIYPDSEFVRVPLERAERLIPKVPASSKLWIDPCVDGMDNTETRSERPWFDFVRAFPNFEKVREAKFQSKPVPATVSVFVAAIMEMAARLKPAWITVPQLPFSKGAERNKFNRELATAAGQWKSRSSFKGCLILPLVFTHQAQVNGKTERNPKLEQARRCYDASGADGFWVVDKSLSDDSGSRTLRNTRFPGLVSLHEELNECIPSAIRIAGPYWALNLVLWARGLVDYPAIGVGSGYQYYLSGGHASVASARVALPSLRRRAGVGRLRPWLDKAIAGLAPPHVFRAELVQIRTQLTTLNQTERAREQVATFYKSWFDSIASQPPAGRSLALFQDLSAAYALGRSLPELDEDGTARRPESVAESLMTSCL